MGSSTQHCPFCAAAVPANVPRDRHAYFTRLQCPRCHEWLLEDELVSKDHRMLLRWGHPLDMTPEEAAIIADNSHWNAARPYFHFDASLAGLRQIQRPNAAAWTKNYEPPVFRPVNDPAPGANQIHHVVLDDTFNDEALGCGNSWERERYRCGAYSGPFCYAGPSDTMVSGIQIGTPYDDSLPDLAPPWASPSENAYCRLGYRLNALQTPLYSSFLPTYFECSVGDGVTPTFSTDLSYLYNWPITPFIELDYNPYIPAIICRIDGREIYRHTDTATLPHFAHNVGAGNYAQAGFGIYTESGSDAAGFIQGYFIRARASIYHAKVAGDGGATLWYPV